MNHQTAARELDHQFLTLLENLGLDSAAKHFLVSRSASRRLAKKMVDSIMTQMGRALTTSDSAKIQHSTASLLTECAESALEEAKNEALRRNHENVSTRHILFGLLKQKDGTAYMFISSLNADIELVTALVERMLQPAKVSIAGPADLAYTEVAENVIELARSEALKLGCRYIGSEHLLLALLLGMKGVEGEALTSIGITEQKIREMIQVKIKEL